MNAIRTDRSWSNRLLPLMTRMLVGLTLLFFLGSGIQLVVLQSAILKTRPLRQPDAEYLVSPLATPAESLRLDSAQLRALMILEVGNLDRHYRQANLLLLSRVWTHFLGFSTGMILALVGASFILGKLESDRSEISASAGGISMSVATLSPGLGLVVLGTLLMALTLLVHHPIEVREAPVYIGPAQGGSRISISEPPALDFPRPQRPAMPRDSQ